MKNMFSRISVSLVAIFFFASTSHAVDQVTTLKSKDVPYLATIDLRDAGHDKDGRKLVSYRINLASSKCNKLVIAGTARFFAISDSLQNDSEFLPNGDVVKTNIFKDNGQNGEVALIMDVESKRPQYAGVFIRNSSAVNNGCFRVNEISYNFFNW